MIPSRATSTWLALLAVSLTLAPTPLQAQPSACAEQRVQTFPQTGKAVRGRFLDYWESTGGLMQYGYPISDEMLEYSDIDGLPYAVQYFERSVMGLHPKNRPPYDVLLQLLGSLSYAANYPSDRYPKGAPGQQANTDDAVKFAETGKSLGGRFLQYWRQTGGLMRHGFPISDEFQQVSKLDGRTYTVQYFQLSVLEYHRENKPPYDVLLSQLGTFRWQQKNAPWKPPADIPATFLPNAVPDGLYIPLYPGTTPVDVYSIEDKGYSDRRVTYRLPPSLDDAGYGFYSDAMPGLGWETLYRDESRFDTYALNNPDGVAPWYMVVMSYAKPRDKGKGILYATLDYHRAPDRTKTPIYPGGYHIEVSSMYTETTAERRIITETTYLVDARSDVVAQYYKETLPTYGWVAFEKGGQPGFYAAIGDMNHNDDPNFRIDGLELHPTSSPLEVGSDVTRVVLRLSALEFQPIP